MPTRQAWAEAYYAQALSDWSIFLEFQRRSDIPRAQALHYLQMATEKLAKAYRFRDTATDVDALLTSHVGFAPFMNAFLLSDPFRREYAGRAAQFAVLRRDCGRLARSVEQLAPAVDRVGYPGNAEYPWADGERAIVPATWGFPDLALLYGPRGRAFLKVIERAVQEFDPG